MQLIKTGRTALFAALLSLFMLAASPSMALASDVTIDFDDTDKDCTADNPSDVYYIRGESHDHNLTVKGGTEDNPIVVHLQNLLLDMSDEDKSAVNVERGSYAKFVLDDGCTATLKGGARRGFAIDGYGRAALRTAGSHVTITGSGTLNAHGRDDSKNGTSGSDGGAGIGGSHNEGCGALVISDVDGAPTINAHGSGQAAAIGTGDDYKSGNGDAHWDENDSIAITGGTVDADVPEQDGAAIGTGRDSDLGSIKITGAPVVTAKTTHEDAAAIGAAYKGSVGSIEIDITGGSIAATAEGDDSAGIGTSDGSPKDDGRVGSISITTSGTASVTARAHEEAAGIGLTVGAELGTITISAKGESTITAHGGESGAGIGGAAGNYPMGKSPIKISTADSATINAQGGENGAGIGSGNGKSGDIEIAMDGGTINAKGTNDGAGIGSGNDESGAISISGTGTINAEGDDYASGIGSADAESAGAITIEGAAGGRKLIVYAASYRNSGNDHPDCCAAIGGGSGDVGDITLKNATVTATPSTHAAAIGTAEHGDIGKITIDNCAIETQERDKDGYAITNGKGRQVGIGATGQRSDVGSIVISDTDYVGTCIGVGYHGDVRTITITDSNITATPVQPVLAKNDEGEAATGIGAGLEGSAGSITITGSTVVANGISGGPGIGNGGALNEAATDITAIHNGSTGSIVIDDSTVTATGSVGGESKVQAPPPNEGIWVYYIAASPGIGCGGNSHVDKIAIKGSTVTSTAGSDKYKGAAGIGAGSFANCGPIEISDSTVVATGKHTGAGIGSGGIDTRMLDVYDISEGIANIIKTAGIKTSSISIADSNVTARGGSYGGAGIGGARNGSVDGDITIADSVVDAKGGGDGAGIGTGCRETAVTGSLYMDHTIAISGASQVTATGGDRSAGIGGSFGAAVRTIDISLTTVQDPEVSSNHGFTNFVKATGGRGAAGIGSGAATEGAVQPGSEGVSVAVSGGYVYAKGGGIGAGAAGAGPGIGVGAARSGKSHNDRINGFTVIGGYIEAVAGGSGADDIGCGVGTENKGTGVWNVTGGTILADTWNVDSPIIDGGSISAQLTGAKNSAHERVHQTTLKAIAPNVPVDPDGIATAAHYGTNDMYSHFDSARVWSYLPASDADAQHATLHYSRFGDGIPESEYFWGTTKTDGSGWLKTGGTAEFIPLSKKITVGNPFTLSLDDASLGDTGWTFTSTGAARVSSAASTASPGASVNMTATAAGPYTVTAKSTAADRDDERYWNHTATYTGNVEAIDTFISFMDSPSKTYDGRPAVHPEVYTNSPGDVRLSYRGHTATGKTYNAVVPPTEAGDYTVTAQVAASGNYSEASISEDFAISPAPTTVVLTAQDSGAASTVTATVSGLHEAAGSVTFTVEGSTVTRVVDVAAATGNTYTAQFTVENVPAGTYKVSATFASPNYVTSQTERTFDKEKSIRTIDMDSSYRKTYGDADFKLSAQAVPATDHDMWTYEVVDDGGEAVVAVDDEGNVSIKHAGRALVKVTLTDGTGDLYEPAEAIVEIDVAKKEITVASQLMDEAGGAPQTSVVYGSIPTDPSRYVLSIGNATDAEAARIRDALAAQPLDAATPAGTAVVKIARRTAGAGGGGASTTYDLADYRLTLTRAPVQVAKRNVVISAADATGVYGGAEPAYALAYDADLPANRQADAGMASFDTVAGVFTTAPAVSGPDGFADLDAGTYEDKIAATGGESANYNVTFAPGTLTVAPASLRDASRVSVGQVDPVVYNGRAHTVAQSDIQVTDTKAGASSASPLSESDYDVTVAGDATNAGTARAVVTGTGNYTGSVVRKLEILPAELTIKTPSAARLYDGSALTAEGSMSGLAAGETATFKTTGTQTEVGSSPNSYKLTWDGTANRMNYRTNVDVGTLTVLENDISNLNVIAPDDVTYDGRSHEQTMTVTGEGGRVLVAGTDYTLSYDGDTTNAGSVTVTATGTGAYTGEASATYAIKPARLLIETASATKAYDGSPLVGSASMDGLIDSETATLAATGTLTDPGSTPDTYTLTWDGTAKEQNYRIREKIGTLTVETSDALTVTAGNYSAVYDGRIHTAECTANVAGATFEYSVDGGDTWSATAPSIKDVGEMDYTVRASAFGYNAKTAEGTLVVTAPDKPVTVVVAADNLVKPVGAKDPEFTAQVVGTLGSDTVDYEFSREEGETEGVYRITVTGESVQGVYNVVYVPGTLTITNDALPMRTITFDLDGGTLNGSEDPIVWQVREGQEITLPEAPVRDGYRFVEWHGSSYQPGDEYRVEGDHTFTAVWSAQAPAAAGDQAAQRATKIVATGDTTPIAALALGAIAALAIIIGAASSRRACAIHTLG
ncbi:MBG domain-containing protein [Slackia exigua]|uniref:MBG domain-containing protein n=1 Tax=Slackia exigua TaxID=84109 RepID=UPI003AB92752